MSAQQTAPKPTGYEFSSMQNSTIQTLADRMKAIGILFLVFAGFAAIGGFFVLFKSIPSAVSAFLEVALFGFVGLWTYRGAAAFHLIVQTRGSDISHLMDALEDLRKIYNLQFWLMVVILGLMALGVLALIVQSL